MYGHYKKAEILQEQFCSVITKVKLEPIPELENRTDKTIEDLEVVEASARKEILALTPVSRPIYMR